MIIKVIGDDVHDDIEYGEIPRKIPIRENCHSQKVYGIFPIWQFM